MQQVVAQGGWRRWLTIAALLLSLGAVVAALVAALGSGQGAWHFRTGFLILRGALAAAALGSVLALVGLFVAKGRRMTNVIALVLGAGFLVYLGLQVQTARSVPMVHDITTNLDDPPSFETLPRRTDSLETVPETDRPEIARLAPVERWKALHREAYGDLQTVRVPWSPSETIRKAERIAFDNGWEVATNLPDQGRLEATATTFFFRFKDDVVVRARPAPDGGSLVDVRSVSRVGVSDVGVNARRIRAFLEDLQRS